MVRICIIAGIGIGMGRICTSTSPSSYPIEKFKYFSYPYPVNKGILPSKQR